MTKIIDDKNMEDTVIPSINPPSSGELAAVIAHEIRNPLTAIKGFLKLMHESENKEFYYQIMLSEIERTEHILTEMLSLAKPQKETLGEVDFCRILDQTILLFKPAAEFQGIKMVKKFSTDIPKVKGDGNQLKQVFINFIKNSMEAMPDGGSLTVEVMRNDSHILVRFADEGCGIPAEFLSKIGQPFFTTKEKGTGLGFMISKNIIEKHHGQLFISSEENKGTTIEMSFPILE